MFSIFSHIFFLSVKDDGNIIRGRGTVKENLVIEGPSNFMDEKSHPLVWCTCQGSMQDMTVVILHILHNKHRAMHHLIFPYNNAGKVDIIAPILQIKKERVVEKLNN